jgi:hypothetical protein
LECRVIPEVFAHRLRYQWAYPKRGQLVEKAPRIEFGACQKILQQGLKIDQVFLSNKRSKQWVDNHAHMSGFIPESK